MPNLELQWLCKKFNALSVNELYAILRLRSEVFVAEQNCVFLDMDNKDHFCYHLMGWQQNNLVAYARLIPPDKVYAEMSIGRVVTSPLFRKNGAGKLLMQTAIEQCHILFGNGPIKIGAQLYLKKFYEGFGFEQSSDIYDEDGIDHIEMIRK